MGATNCPETPRQKMITMMYLVYTAMLALNVSAEVVEGFRTVGTAMTKSNENLQVKLDDTYANFQTAYSNSPEKVRDKWERAQQVRELSNQLGQTIDSIEYTFIGSLISDAEVMIDPATEQKRKISFINADGSVNIDSVRLALQLDGLRWMEKGLDNTNDGTRFFLGAAAEGEEATEGAAFELKQKILEYEHRVKEILGEDSNHVNFGFNVDKKYWSNHEKKELAWEMLNFRETVAGSGIVTLIRLKGETMNAEFDAVNTLYSQVSKGDFKFDQITMISRPKATYIVQGGVYETRVNVGAYDSKQKFTATVNGQQLMSNDSGAVVYRTVCNTPGPQKVTGVAHVTNPDGGIQDIPINDYYYVSQPMANISLDAMNVVYIGLDNPFTPSVPGIDSRNIQVSIDPKDGKITPGETPGQYIIVPTGAKSTLNINVTATIDGKQQQMGSPKFRVKKMPQPKLLVANFESGGAAESKKTFVAGARITARKSPDFDLKVDPRKMKVTKVTAQINNKPAGEGTDMINEEMATNIRRAVRGDRLFITATVMMPDGKPTTIEWQKTLK